MRISTRLPNTSLLILFLCFGAITNTGASEHSAVDHGAIASAHPLATKAGMQILASGGNAFDAAVAVSSVLAVVEPYGSGLGGGGFWLLHQSKTKRTVMVDGREQAPGKADKDMYLDNDGNFRKRLAIEGALASGIPGSPAALVHISRQYGRLPLQTVLAPAIKLAREGYIIDEKYRLYAKLRLKTLRSNREAARIFLHNDDVPPAGYVLKQPDLAETLNRIANEGEAGFYEGKVATLLVDGVRLGKGIWRMADLQQYRVVEREPVVFNYHGMRITAAAPPSSGGIALMQMLGILDQFRLPDLNEVERKHLIIEAMRHAYADRAKYLGDPDFVQIPRARLTSTEYLKTVAADISMNEATPSEFLSDATTPVGAGADTTHFSVIDADGNRVAATMSINYPFGACFVPPGTGILLNDEMDDFVAKPGVANAYGLTGSAANAIAPHKRPLSSMSPTFIESADRIAVIGTPGGSRIITMVLLAILDFERGSNAEQIVNTRRFHHQYLPDIVMYEDDALAANEVEQLSRMGHALKLKMSPYGGGQGSYGNMQVVIKDKASGRLSAASDPRGHGLAIVE